MNNSHQIDGSTQSKAMTLEQLDSQVNRDLSKLVGAEARVLSVNSSKTKGVVKDPVPQGEFLEDLGLKGDAHSGPWHRMVSLLAHESYDRMVQKGSGELAIGSFAENITTLGVELYRLPLGTRLAIGETIQEVTQIGKECHTGCQIRQLVGDCVMPREGIFTRIIRGGVIRPGDAIQLITETK